MVSTRKLLQLYLILIFTFLLIVTIAIASIPPLQAQEPTYERTLYKGMWGEDVFRLQRQLMDLELLSEATGRYDTATVQAVKKLQKAYGLEADGIVGPATFKVLENLREHAYYIVKKGDSLYSIAKALNISMDHLVSLNSLSDSTLRVGQKLKIPVQARPRTYTVQPGDSLYKIARRFDVTVDQLIKINKIENPRLIRPGQELTIPPPS